MKLLVCSPASFQLEAPEVGEYLAIVYGFAVEQNIEITKSGVRKGQVHQIRNGAVEQAQEQGYDRILFVDPDMVVDRYLAAGQEPFLPSAWEFLNEHPGCVAAAPYCGPWPKREIHAFGCNPATGELFRADHGFCQWREGWQKVAAVGTGLMLVDVSIFDDLTPPFFDYEFWTEKKTRVKHSQDITFCRQVREAGHEIWVNFSSWQGHYQNSIVDPPGLEGQRDGEIEHGKEKAEALLDEGKASKRRNGEPGAALPEGSVSGASVPDVVVQEA